MVEITLVEIHLENAQFDANAEAEAIANAPLSGLRGLLGGSDDEAATESRTDETAGTDTETVTSGDRPGPSLGKLLLGVVVLAAVGAVARRFLGGDTETADTAGDETAEIAEIDVGE